MGLKALIWIPTKKTQNSCILRGSKNSHVTELRRNESIIYKTRRIKDSSRNWVTLSLCIVDTRVHCPNSPYRAESLNPTLPLHLTPMGWLLTMHSWVSLQEVRLVKGSHLARSYTPCQETDFKQRLVYVRVQGLCLLRHWGTTLMGPLSSRVPIGSDETLLPLHLSSVSPSAYQCFYSSPHPISQKTVPTKPPTHKSPSQSLFWGNLT